MQLSPVDMAKIYQRLSQERRGEVLNTRVPRRLKTSVERLAEFWTAKEKITTGDPDVEVSLGDVVVRLLDLGLASAWEEAGVEPVIENETVRPPTEEQVEQLIQDLQKSST